MSTETYPNITWAAEYRKPFTGTDWQQGQAVMLRSVEAYLTVAELRAEPINPENMRGWLAKCLYACNMENFKI